ncbi:MAG: glycosyltransferase, partial [Planctomycetota bacterium]|nr:glycosyltransferase [Planctomycetota bacterium]
MTQQTAPAPKKAEVAVPRTVAPGSAHADAASWPRPPVSVVILTLNEEDNIGDCIDSCAWCDDVHVLDSGSTDRTCDYAEALGAGVHHHPFTGFGAQRNWA